MKYIAYLPNLQNLNLSFSCRITEKGISHLSNHTNLVILNLSNLQELDICGNDLNINNIKYLINNKKLHTLHISFRYESIKKIEKFQNVYVNCIKMYMIHFHKQFLF
jgi:hypothetical protein